MVAFDGRADLFQPFEHLVCLQTRMRESRSARAVGAPGCQQDSIWHGAPAIRSRLSTASESEGRTCERLLWKYCAFERITRISRSTVRSTRVAQLDTSSSRDQSIRKALDGIMPPTGTVALRWLNSDTSMPCKHIQMRGLHALGAAREGFGELRRNSQAQHSHWDGCCAQRKTMGIEQGQICTWFSRIRSTVLRTDLTCHIC